MPDTTTERPLRLCDSCGGLDDHPRHSQVVADTVPSVPDKAFLASVPDGTPATAIALALRPGIVIRHIDCCAALGCVICQATEQATAGLRGQALIDSIAGGALDGFKAPEVTDNKELGHDG